MTTELLTSIYNRYSQALRSTEHLSLDVVQFALTLAIQDVAAALRLLETKQQPPPPCPQCQTLGRYLAQHEPEIYNASPSPATTDAITVIERLRDQIIRLNDWLAEHAPDEYHSDGDTADSMIAAADALRGRVARLTRDYHEINAQLVATDADNAKLADELRTLRSWSVAPTGNGKSHPAAEMLDAIAPEDNASWNDAMLSMLDAETADYWHGIAAGRWTWRKLPKSVRLAMVRHVLSFGPEERAMSMSEFDAIKPHWMPSAGSHPITFGVPWSTLSDLRREIEVTL